MISSSPSLKQSGSTARADRESIDRELDAVFVALDGPFARAYLHALKQLTLKSKNCNRKCQTNFAKKRAEIASFYPIL